jgi:hypothetical protein
MLKNITFLLIVFIFSALSAYSQDTSAYEIQRNKINALLDQRSEKFGRYDESLNARTGIFGFQTKRDIKNSNEILRQIALNDNEIFRELKVLLDYKDLQVEQIRNTANYASENLINYRKSIKNLQDRNEILQLTIKSNEQKISTLYILVFIALITIITLVYRLMLKNKKLIH